MKDALLDCEVFLPSTEILGATLSCVNVVLTKRDGEIAQVGGEGQETETIKILAVNEFDSKRKCMSVIVRIAAPKESSTNGSNTSEKVNADENPSTEVEWGPPILLCKGADTAMFAACKKSTYYESCKVHVDDFACTGLRTLVMAQRVLSEDEFAEWFENYKVGSKSLVNRKEMLQRCAVEIGEYYCFAFWFL